ncbi:MAG: hypothetical protein PHU29_02120, partial [Sulfuricurvum sp.]|nr:hypothetical protein [Sulfuricurvum sp.]
KIKEYNNMERAKEAAYYIVYKGLPRTDAVSLVKEKEILRNDPENYVSDENTITYLHSYLNEPQVPETSQIDTIAKDLLEKYNFDIEEC